MARMTAADALVDALRDWGVEVIFGLPGDGINGIIEALRLRKDENQRDRPRCRGNPDRALRLHTEDEKIIRPHDVWAAA